MSKTIGLILAVVSMAAVALPTGAIAQEIHSTNVTVFSGTTGAGTFTAEGEPTITCGGIENLSHATGTVSAGGTTGTTEVDLTNCHTSVFGFTAKCRTEGSALDDTIKTTNTFHLITANGKPASLVTGTVATVICAGISSMKVSGNLIWTITSPACGGSSNSMTLRTTASGSTQEDKTYTGVTYNPTVQTNGGASKEAGVTAEVTGSSPTVGTLNCT